jgi:glycosyltransferase involved in cell wall biosynthesis
MTGSPFISVVIPTYNRKDTLLECLQSLEAQSYPHTEFEIIVVIDGSGDGTQAAVEEFAARTRVHVRCHTQTRAGPSAARNTGAAKTAGAIIAFTEDDVKPETVWLERAAGYFADPATSAVEGRTRSPGSGSVRSFEKPGTPGFLPCNLFVRRDAFFAVGGFDPQYCDLSLNLYFREDADFGFRLLEHGSGVRFGSDVVVVHPDQFPRARDILRHARRYFFDPLLYRNHPLLYRKLIEVKRLGPFEIHRPAHYLCWFYLVSFIAIFSEMLSGHHMVLLPSLLIMLVAHLGIRFRYRRNAGPSLSGLSRTAVLAVLPFIYLAWFFRGCLRFGGWRALL